MSVTLAPRDDGRRRRKRGPDTATARIVLTTFPLDPIVSPVSPLMDHQYLVVEYQKIHERPQLHNKFVFAFQRVSRDTR